MGRLVQFHVSVWDDPDAPIMTSDPFIATVGPGAEFDIARQMAPPFQLVPVEIDITRSRIRFAYTSGEEGFFAHAVFNGFILTFPSDCVLFEGAAIDPKGTTLPMSDDDLLVRPQSLGINVAGRSYGRDTVVTIRVDTTDCPLS